MEENKRIKGTYGYIDSLKRSKLAAIGIWAVSYTHLTLPTKA